MLILATLLEFVPYIGPVVSVLGMVTDVIAEPSAGGAMGGLATTVALTRALKPYIDKAVAWTDTEYDDRIWDWFTTILGWIVKASAAMGGRKAKADNSGQRTW